MEPRPQEGPPHGGPRQNGPRHATARGRAPAPDPHRAVYGISVAAELVGSEPQSLRLYEARGLLAPARTEGGTRRYSETDLGRLRQIGDLLDGGLNLAGIVMVLELQAANEDLRRQLERARRAGPTRLRSPSEAGTAGGVGEVSGDHQPDGTDGPFGAVTGG